ncbi:aryl-sulfate sulfotransferase [Weissella confusa]|uniref:aryl-sulfate sulfotransferase n=1 Tax=Weissella confusa TaxID=1583 RepID=UPI0035A2B9BE
MFSFIKRHKIMTSTLAVVVVAGLATAGYHAYKESHPTLLTTAEIKQNLGLKLSNKFTNDQKAANKTYASAMQNSQYTVDNMYTKVNPYGTSPLTAFVIFQTDQKATVSYSVAGKTKATTISNDIDGETTTHKIPVVGLYADTANKVTFTIKYADGHTDEKTITLRTKALPKSMSNIKIDVKKSDADKMSLGDNSLTVMARTTKEPFAIDASGDIRWYSTTYNEHIFKTLKNGHLLMMRKQNNSALVYNDLIETDYMGRIYKTYHFSNKTSGSDNATMKNKSEGETTAIHHDVIELPNGDLLATVSDGSKYIEDTMIVIDRQTGEINRVIDFKKIFPAEMYTKYTSTKRADGGIDWLHQNSINYDESDDSIVISARNQDLVMKFDFKTMKPIWILSSKAKSSWPKKWQKYVLTYADGTSINGGQHDATVVVGSHNGSKETITLYDNNIAVTNGDKKSSGKYSQGMQLEIDTKTMTAKETWAYGKTRGTANYTDRIGSTALLSNGNYLIDFGYLNEKNGDASNIVEVTADNEVVFDVELSNLQNKGYVYRAYRVNIK